MWDRPVSGEWHTYYIWITFLLALVGDCGMPSVMIAKSNEYLIEFCFGMLVRAAWCRHHKKLQQCW